MRFLADFLVVLLVSLAISSGMIALQIPNFWQCLTMLVLGLLGGAWMGVRKAARD